MLKSRCQYYGGESTLFHTISPHRLIPPPIKRSTILVSDGVVIIISVKLYTVKYVAVLVALSLSTEACAVQQNQEGTKELFFLSCCFLPIYKYNKRIQFKCIALSNHNSTGGTIKIQHRRTYSSLEAISLRSPRPQSKVIAT